MQYANFFSELFESPLVVTENGLKKYLPYILQHQQGQILDFPELPALEMRRYGTADLNQLPVNEKASSVAVIPVNGLMTRSGSWWDYGADDYAALLNQAYEDDSIKSIVLRMRCVGGSVGSSFPIKEALDKRNKKVWTAVDSYAYSMGYYMACLTDGIFPVGEMAGLGSIGIYAEIQDNKKMLEQYGIKIIEVIPPESKWKNKTISEAKKGKTDLLIKEELTPWALHFQKIVREARPKLNEEIEGILEGRTFFAYDGIENGLANKIMTFEKILEYAANYETNRNKKISNFFNN